jgi:hypothetical protein
LKDNNNDSEKVKRIKEIQKEGQKPIIKVIARNLTSDQALLVEKTLIWKLGKNLTNKSSGHFADKFRPHNTFHQEKWGFDFENGIYYVNAGQADYKDINRSFSDCKKYGFLSAGQGIQWSNPIRKLKHGDIVVVYVKKHGYAGIGKVEKEAVRINDFRYKGKSLTELPLTAKGLFRNSDNEKTEYVVTVSWIKVVDSKQAKFKRNSGLFTSTHIVASLENQLGTIQFLEKEFNVKFKGNKVIKL